MQNDRKKFAIMKGINYKDSSPTHWKKHIDYIFSRDRSPEKYQKTWFVDHQDPLKGLEQLYERYHPRGNRAFKHWIVSFGDSNLSPDKAFQISKEIAGYYAKDYPLLLGLHTNLPKRLHCHFLQSTVNVRSGKKFSQSLAEFNDFRKFINSVLEGYEMPLLRGVPSEKVETVSKIPFIMEDDIDFSQHTYPVNYENPEIFSTYTMNLPTNGNVAKMPIIQLHGSFNPNECLQVIENTLDKFFEFGRSNSHE